MESLPNIRNTAEPLERQSGYRRPTRLYYISILITVFSSSTQGTGFSLKWRAVELTGCPEQTYTAKEGVISSPNYPHFLLPDLDCTIDILAPAGKRVFLNISFYDFGYGTFVNGVPFNTTSPEDSFLTVQVDSQNPPIQPFVNPNVLTNCLFVSISEVMRLRLKTAENVTGIVSFVNISHVVELRHVRSGRVSAPNWPGPAPPRSLLSTRLVAPHGYTLSLTVAGTTLARPGDTCGDGQGWIEV
ncbi:unnamed protein product [Leptidea sinapis]|uniref:CUB domain-containing protein n=1 Tax=Leptidea sinapis TaxID=189913 RepID=A0A5E4QPI4_9NEOP|nr:unnamed protein product [Leptidea sinapis]